jgi:transposase InsO family protein
MDRDNFIIHVYCLVCDGRSFRTLNVIDICTRRCLGIEIDTSLISERVPRLLIQAWRVDYNTI